MAKGTWKVTIRKLCNGVPYGTDEFWISFVYTQKDAEAEAMRQAAFEYEDEFDTFEVVNSEFTEDF
jgi:hypothetical protein